MSATGNGIPEHVITEIEKELTTLDIEAVTDRMDTIFGKAWSYKYDGPYLVEVPVSAATGNRKAPVRPHWQVNCSVEITHIDDNDAYIYARDYPMLLEAVPGAFEVIRDLSLIYCLVCRWGLGKQSANPLPLASEYKPMEASLAPVEDHRLALGELQEIRQQLGIKKNTDLDSYVREFSGGKLQHWRQIGKSSLRPFVDYMKEHLDGVSPQ